MARRILVTGLNGTVAPFVASRLRSTGNEVVAWDRTSVPEHDLAASTAFLARTDPAGVFHIGMGPPEWAGLMAEWCRDHGRRFAFTSTASVFSSAKTGPLTIDDTPDAIDDYGSYKRACEEKIVLANPDALVVRLGWQIGDSAGSNNMLDYFEQHARDGNLTLSRQWFPACSFLDDTAVTLVDLENREATGLYHLDGNPGLSIFEIGCRLSRFHADRWQVNEAEQPRFNNLMRDDRVDVAPITARLPRLRDFSQRSAVKSGS